MTGATILPFKQPDRRGESRDQLRIALLHQRARLAAQPAALRAAINCLAGAVPPATGAIDLAPLRALRACVFVAPGHEPQLQRIWRETLATAVLAGLIAGPLGLDRTVLVGAALLHRLDEVLFVSAVARVDASAPLPLRGAALRRAFAGRDTDLDGLLEGWDLDARIVSAVRGWRTCLDRCDGGAGFAPSRGVYFGHLLAMTRLYPDEGVPGIVELAAQELGVPDEVGVAVCMASPWLTGMFRALSGV
jgi:hypothetical protein